MTVMPLARVYDANVPPERTDVAWALRQLTTANAHYADYQLYKDYLTGKHRTAFDSSEHQAAFRDFLRRLRCNICPAIIAALTDRLKIQGFVGDQAAADRAWVLWDELGLAATANRVHSEAVGMGDAYLLIWPDTDGTPRLYPHTALEMCHAHDEERPEVTTKAAKLWQDGKRYRLTLYYADRIEKYRTTSDNTTGGTITAPSFAPYELPDEPWPLPNDYGTTPVFHFPYDADTHRHGVSALRDVLPIQDSINQTILNRAVVLDFGAYPMRILMGVEEDVYDDPSMPNYGEAKRPIRAGIDRLMTFANPDTKIGQFDAADVDPYNKALHEDLNLITVMTGIPPHHFMALTGDFPSGEALKTSEARLVSRTEDAQVDLTADWGRALAFLLQVDGGAAGAAVRPEWVSPQSRRERDDAEIAEIKQRVGVSTSKLLQELGYDAEEITTMQAEREAERQTSVAAFENAFNKE